MDEASLGMQAYQALLVAVLVLPSGWQVSEPWAEADDPSLSYAQILLMYLKQHQH